MLIFKTITHLNNRIKLEKCTWEEIEERRKTTRVKIFAQSANQRLWLSELKHFQHHLKNHESEASALGENERVGRVGIFARCANERLRPERGMQSADWLSLIELWPPLQHNQFTFS